MVHGGNTIACGDRCHTQTRKFLQFLPAIDELAALAAAIIDVAQYSPAPLGRSGHPEEQLVRLPAAHARANRDIR
jgi:hypothetical protein